MNKPTESIYEKVYGEMFAMYTREEMSDFTEPLRVRFRNNDLDAKTLFAGKRCLDAGCGNGRGSLFMLENGAAHVEGLDFSEINVETATRMAAEFGYGDSFRAQQKSLEQIPFADNHFDIVWCNGVIQHTAHPNQCLSEITRVLKPQGESWLYIYGSGGAWWQFVYAARELLADVEIDQAIHLLKSFRYATRYIAEFIDDWYAAFVRTYTAEDLKKRLLALGFEQPERALGGMNYDTSEHVRSIGDELHQKMVGDGDLRYWLRKTGVPHTDQALLDEGLIGSSYDWPVELKLLEESLKALNIEVLPEPWQRVAACARIQREIRLLLDQRLAISPEQVAGIVNETIADITAGTKRVASKIDRRSA